MSACIDKKRLILYFYDDLETDEKKTIELHLEKCTQCQNHLDELGQLRMIIPPRANDIEAELTANRNVLSGKLLKTSKHVPFSSIHPRPVFQACFAVIILLLGFFIGRQMPVSDTNRTTLEHLLTANKSIKTENAAIQPLLLRVEKVKFDSKSGLVEIFYNTASDIRLKGHVTEPEIKEILHHAIQEKDNPAVRLHALKAMRETTSRGAAIDKETLDILQNLFISEQNQGVKLTGLKVLRSVVQDHHVKEILIQILLFDDDPAVRIEAFKALTLVNPQEMQGILEIAQKDDNQYIRHKAEKMLESL